MKITRVCDGSLINEETGEVMTAVEYAFIAVPRRSKINGWFMAFQEAFEALSKDRELWGTPRAVLDYLLSRLDFDNFILVQQSEVAAALGIGRDQVSRSTAKLVEKGVLLKGPKAGRTCAYKLNSSYGWKGRVTNLNQERRARLSVAVDNTKP
jgi:hypothetical protein